MGGFFPAKATSLTALLTLSSSSLSTSNTGSGKLLPFLHFPCQSHSQFSSLSSSPRTQAGSDPAAPSACQGSSRMFPWLCRDVGDLCTPFIPQVQQRAAQQDSARFLLALKALVSVGRRSRSRHPSDPEAARSSPRERKSSGWSRFSL